jgi:hypothetical protein
LRRDLIGNAIYETVEKITGLERAPKVTGMLIDLSEAELNQAISTYENLEKKVTLALSLLKQSEEQEALMKKPTQA